MIHIRMDFVFLEKGMTLTDLAEKSGIAPLGRRVKVAYQGIAR